jgi:uncharacterized membrane protein
MKAIVDALFHSEKKLSYRGLLAMIVVAALFASTKKIPATEFVGFMAVYAAGEAYSRKKKILVPSVTVTDGDE